MASPEKHAKTGPGRPKLSLSVLKSNVDVRNRSRIAIGDQIDRWLKVKTETKAKSNSQVARVLLDIYYTTRGVSHEEVYRSNGQSYGDRAMFVAPSTSSIHSPLFTLLESEKSRFSDSFLEYRAAKTVVEMDVQTPASSNGQQMSTPLPGMSSQRLPAPEASSVPEGSDSAADRNVETVHAGPSSVTVKRTAMYKSPESTEHQLPDDVVVKHEPQDTEIIGNHEAVSLSGPSGWPTNRLEDKSSESAQHQLPDNVVVKHEPIDTEISESHETQTLSGLTNCSINPLDVAIEVIEDDTSSTDTDSDSDAETYFDVTIGTCVPEDVKEISFADVVYGFVDEECEKETEETIKKEAVRVDTVESIDLMEQTVLLCYRNSLLDLARHCFDEKCQEWNCSSEIKIYEKSLGSAVSLTWVCDSGHIRYTWCSQPVIGKGLHAGDLLTSAGILFSGNDYQKIKLMAQFMKMPIVNEKTYNRIEKTCLVPSVEQVWQEHQRDMLRNIKYCLKEIIILGDGCMNSDGHCAQYCTYTAMDNYSKEVLSVITVDDQEMGNSSMKMEKEALHCTLKLFQDEGFRIKEVITDDNTSIAAYVRKQYPDIKHSIDVWHAARNIARRIMKASHKKDCGMLREWCGYIVNHFYHTCQVTKTVQEFIAMWFCVLHGPLSDESDTYNRIAKDSRAHHALKCVVMHKKLLTNIQSFLSARNTANLDEFNNLLLLYAGKHYSYTPPVYRARNLLAAMDHNVHLNRVPKKHTDGMVRMHKVFNKTSRRWSLKLEKKKKSYNYIDNCFKYAFLRHSTDGDEMQEEVVHPETDPQGPASTTDPVKPQGPASTTDPVKPQGPASTTDPVKPQGPASTTDPVKPQGPASTTDTVKLQGPASTTDSVKPPAKKKLKMVRTCKLEREMDT